MATTDIVTHTPGPWHLDDNSPDDEGFIAVLVGPPNSIDEHAIALVGGRFCDHDHDVWADARVTAAAPELLDCLQNLVLTAVWDGKPYHEHREMRVPEMAIEHARAAIAKARGQQ